MKLDARYDARGKESRMSLRFLTWMLLACIELRKNWMEAIWRECKSKFLDNLSLRCLLDLQGKMLIGRWIWTIRLLIGSIYSYGTIRVVSIDSEEKRQGLRPQASQHSEDWKRRCQHHKGKDCSFFFCSLCLSQSVSSNVRLTVSIPKTFGEGVKNKLQKVSGFAAIPHTSPDCVHAKM